MRLDGFWQFWNIDDLSQQVQMFLVVLVGWLRLGALLFYVRTSR
jgi:hypothetical protein